MSRAPVSFDDIFAEATAPAPKVSFDDLWSKATATQPEQRKGSIADMPRQALMGATEEALRSPERALALWEMTKPERSSDVPFRDRAAQIVAPMPTDPNERAAILFGRNAAFGTPPERKEQPHPLETLLRAQAMSNQFVAGPVGLDLQGEGNAPEGFGERIARGVGSGAVQVGAATALAAATRGAGLPAALAVFGGTAAAPVVADTYAEAMNEHGDHKRAEREASLAGSITFATSFFPGAAILRKVPGGDMMVKRAARLAAGRMGGIAAAAGAEGSQEFVEGFAQEIAANMIRRDKQLTKEMVYEALVNPQRAEEFVVGALVGGAARAPIALAPGRRAEPIPGVAPEQDLRGQQAFPGDMRPVFQQEAPGAVPEAEPGTAVRVAEEVAPDAQPSEDVTRSEADADARLREYVARFVAGEGSQTPPASQDQPASEPESVPEVPVSETDQAPETAPSDDTRRQSEPSPQPDQARPESEDAAEDLATTETARTEQTDPEIERSRPVSPSPEGTREPWEMTADEFRDANREGYTKKLTKTIGDAYRVGKTRHILAPGEAIPPVGNSNPKAKLPLDAKVGDVVYGSSGKHHVISVGKVVGGEQKPPDLMEVYRVTTADHRASVARALSEGKPVPAEVLAEYPDLKSPSEAVKAPTQPPEVPSSPASRPEGKGEGEAKGPRVVRMVDELKRYMKGKANIARIDADAKREWLREFGTPSTDTRRKLRYVFEISDGHKVSADGALKMTNPAAYERIRKKHANLATAKAQADIFNALDAEVQDAIVEELPYTEIAEIDKNPQEGVRKYLEREGHIMAGVYGPRRKQVVNTTGYLQEGAALTFADPVESAQAWRVRNRGAGANTKIVTLEKDGRFTTTLADSDKSKALQKHGGWNEVGKAPQPPGESAASRPQEAHDEEGNQGRQGRQEGLLNETPATPEGTRGDSVSLEDRRDAARAARLREFADKKVAQAEALERNSSRRFDNAPGAFVTGGSGRRRSGLHKKTNQAIEGSLEDLRKAKALREAAGKLRSRADHFDPAKKAERAEREAKREEARQRVKAQESAVRKAAPIINEDSPGILRMTKAEWAKTSKDFKGIAVRGDVRVREVVHDSTLQPVFITDMPVRNRPGSAPEPSATESDVPSADSAFPENSGIRNPEAESEAETAAPGKVERLAEQLELFGTELRKGNNIPRGPRTGAAVNFAREIVGLSAQIAARAIRAGVKGAKGVRAFVDRQLAELAPKLTDGKADVHAMVSRILRKSRGADGQYDDARFEAQVNELVAGATGPDQTTKQTIRDQTGLKRREPKTVSAAEALVARYKAEERAAKKADRAARLEERKKAREGLKALSKLTSDTRKAEENIRRYAAKMVEDHVAPGQRGAFLPAIARAKTMGDLAKIAGRVVRTMVKADARTLIRAAGRITTKDIAGLEPEWKTEADAALGAIQRLRESLLDGEIKSTADLELIRDELQAALNTVRAMLHQQKHLDEVRIKGEIVEAAQLRAAMLDRLSQRPELPKTGEGRGAEEAYWKRVARNRTNWESMLEDLDGWQAGGVGKRLFAQVLRGRRESLRLQHEFQDAFAEMVRANGFPSLAAFQAELSGTLGRALQKRVKVKVGEADSISLGQAAYLYAASSDDGFIARIGAGQRMQFRDDSTGKPFVLTKATLDAVAKQIPANVRKIIDDGKALYDAQFFDRMSRVNKRLKGFHLEKERGYWGIKLNRRYSEGAGTPMSWRRQVIRALEEAGFMQERVGPSKSPMLIGDFGTDIMLRSRAAATTITKAEATKLLQRVLLHPDMQTAISARFGKRMVERLERRISLFSGGDMFIEPDMGGLRALQSLWARGKTQLWAPTWARNALAGGVRVLDELDAGDVAKAAAKKPTKTEFEELKRYSPELRERWDGRMLSAFYDPSVQAGEDTNWRLAVEGTFRQLHEAAKNVQGGKWGEVVRSIGEVGKPWKAFLDALTISSYFDAQAAILAYRVFQTKAPQNLDAEGKKRWAARHATRVFERVSNTATNEYANDVQLDARERFFIQSLIPFTGDTAKAMNMLYRSFKRGPKRFARTVGVIALSATMSGIVSALWKAMQGDDPEDALKAGGIRAAQDAASVVPVFGSSLARLIGSYSGKHVQAPELEVPLLEVLNSALGSGVDLVKAYERIDGLEGRQTVTAAEYLGRAIAKVAETASDLSGLPVSGYWRSIRRAIQNYAPE